MHETKIMHQRDWHVAIGQIGSTVKKAGRPPATLSAETPFPHYASGSSSGRQSAQRDGTQVEVYPFYQ